MSVSSKKPILCRCHRSRFVFPLYDIFLILLFGSAKLFWAIRGHEIILDPQRFLINHCAIEEQISKMWFPPPRTWSSVEPRSYKILVGERDGDLKERDAMR